jgi:hypothetical protein
VTTCTLKRFDMKTRRLITCGRPAEYAANEWEYGKPVMVCAICRINNHSLRNIRPLLGAGR